MEYINIPLYVIRSNEYIGADPTQRATWLSLVAWSCDQENMGRIAGARTWGDRRWMQSCGVMASEVAESCGLYRWDGDDLVISFYPADAQREIERKREIARANGRKGGRKPTSEPIPETNVGSDVGNQPRIANEAPSESEKKGKEKKGNIGGETTTVDNTPEEEPPAAPVLPPTPHESFPGLSPGTSPSYGSSAWIALQPLAEWVKTLRPGWGVSKFTGPERCALAAMHKSLGGALPVTAKDCVSRYLAAAPANASKWDYPPDRLLFMKTFGEIVQKAFAWDRAQPRPKKKLKPEEPRQPEGPVVDTDTAAAEIRELRKEMGLGGEA